MGAPFAERHPTSGARPNTIDPSAIATDDDEDKARLFLLVLYPGVEARHALKRTEVNVDGALSGRGTIRAIGGGRGRGEAPPADGDGEGLKEKGNVGEDEGVVGADLGGNVGGSIVVGGDGGERVVDEGRRRYSGGGHRRQRRGSTGTWQRRQGRARLRGGDRGITTPKSGVPGLT